MALISFRQLLDHAAENNYGVPTFNVNNLEQVHSIMNALVKPIALYYAGPPEQEITQENHS